MKFKTSWAGCKAGDIYPTEFAEGDDCPAELEEAARLSGVLDGDDEPAPARKGKGK